MYRLPQTLSRSAALLAALLLLGTACSKSGDPTDPDNPTPNPPTPPQESSVHFTVQAEGLAANEPVSPITVYLFGADNLLYKREQLTVGASNTVEISVLPSTDSYWITGPAPQVAAGTTRADFLELSIGEQLTHNQSAPEFLVGRHTFGSTPASGTVTLKHRTARIDLDATADEAISVTDITLKNVPAAVYPFVEKRTATSRRLDYTQHYAQPLTGLSKDLFRVYESLTPVEVIVEGFYADIPIHVETTFPVLDGNKIYTLAIRNAGSTLTVGFEVAPWEEGDTVVGEPDLEHRILLDPDHSEFTEEVAVDYRSNTIEVPASGSTMTLAFRSDTAVDIIGTEGLTGDVTVGPGRFTNTDDGVISSYTVRVAEQGRGRLGYGVQLHLRYALHAESYDFVDLHVAPNKYQIETVRMAGLEWMAFNARSRDLEDQVYPLDGCPVETMYRTNWLSCVGGLFQFGRLYMYIPWQSYNPSNDLGSQKQDIPWQSDTHSPCPEGYRVPTPAEWNALLPSGTLLPGSFQNGAGETITATVEVAEGAISTPTYVGGTPRYVKFTAADGRCLIFPLAGYKSDKSTASNPGFGSRAVLWANDNSGGLAGGWANTHSIVYNAPNVTLQKSSLQMEAFASVRCVKK